MNIANRTRKRYSSSSARANMDRVYRFILEYKEDHDGNSPTIRIIKDALDLSSTSVVAYYLQGLKDAGKIRLGKTGRASAIEVVGSSWLRPRKG